MLTANQYGNSGAYFNNSTNTRTAAMLGLTGPQKSRVSSYSVTNMGGTQLSQQARHAAPSAAIIGRVGMRLVAFPLVPGWNYSTPLT